VALMIAEFARRHVARGAAWGRIINISTDGALDHWAGDLCRRRAPHGVRIRDA
jgi:hypothetical protein